MYLLKYRVLSKDHFELNLMIGWLKDEQFFGQILCTYLNFALGLVFEIIMFLNKAQNVTFFK